VLALDLGTTSFKAQPFDSRARPVGPVARRAAPVRPDGTADPRSFLAAANQVLDEATTRGPQPPDAVAVTAAWHGLVGLDERGRPTTDITTWMDQRAAPEADDLRHRVGDTAALQRRTGAPIHPSLPPARLAWLAKHQPARFARTARWCTPVELLERAWFSEGRGPSPSMASGSGLRDRDGSWDAELSALLGLAEGSLGSVDDEPHQALSAPYRRRWPALAAVPWFPAWGDGACAVLGSACASPGRAALSVGTSAAVRVLVPAADRRSASVPLSLFRYALDDARSVVGAARSNAGNVVSWAERVLRLPGRDPVEAATRGRSPGGHGLTAEASLAGERSPSWPTWAAARVERLRLHTTPLDVLQALVEAAALGIARGVDALEGWAGPVEVVVSGGAASSAGWRHLLADATGRELLCAPFGEVTARGAAAAALERLGCLGADLGVAAEQVVRPDPRRADAFACLAAGSA
jgi:gluconokinase